MPFKEPYPLESQQQPERCSPTFSISPLSLSLFPTISLPKLTDSSGRKEGSPHSINCCSWLLFPFSLVPGDFKLFQFFESSVRSIPVGCGAISEIGSDEKTTFFGCLYFREIESLFVQCSFFQSIPLPRFQTYLRVPIERFSFPCLVRSYTRSFLPPFFHGYLLHERTYLRGGRSEGKTSCRGKRRRAKGWRRRRRRRYVCSDSYLPHTRYERRYCTYT